MTRTINKLETGFIAFYQILKVWTWRERERHKNCNLKISTFKDLIILNILLHPLKMDNIKLECFSCKIYADNARKKICGAGT